LIEPLSLDEAYLDVTDSVHCHGSATLMAQEIRQTIFNELNLTASAGVAPVKFLAKIASDLNKPNGQYVITPEEVPAFLKTLPLGKIPGVGKSPPQSWKAWGYGPAKMCSEAISPCCSSVWKVWPRAVGAQPGD
jgi:nucleotidyltransferase/DNA polymerase involved in DNA repair